MNKRKIFCPCHLTPVNEVPHGSAGRFKYYCSVTGDQLFTFKYKEKNMAQSKQENLEDTWPGDAPNFPDEDIGEAPDFNEEESANGEIPEQTEEEQPFLFEGDKVYNALHTALTDINDSLKKTEKKLDHTKIEKEILQKRKAEIQEAIEVYEKQRAEAE